MAEEQGKSRAENRPWESVVDLKVAQYMSLPLQTQINIDNDFDLIFEENLQDFMYQHISIFVHENEDGRHVDDEEQQQRERSFRKIQRFFDRIEQEICRHHEQQQQEEAKGINNNTTENASTIQQHDLSSSSPPPPPPPNERHEESAAATATATTMTTKAQLKNPNINKDFTWEEMGTTATTVGGGGGDSSSPTNNGRMDKEASSSSSSSQQQQEASQQYHYHRPKNNNNPNITSCMRTKRRYNASSQQQAMPSPPGENNGRNSNNIMMARTSTATLPRQQETKAATKTKATPTYPPAPPLYNSAQPVAAAAAASKNDPPRRNGWESTSKKTMQQTTTTTTKRRSRPPVQLSIDTNTNREQEERIQNSNHTSEISTNCPPFGRRTESKTIITPSPPQLLSTTATGVAQSKGSTTLAGGVVGTGSKDDVDTSSASKKKPPPPAAPLPFSKSPSGTPVASHRSPKTTQDQHVANGEIPELLQYIEQKFKENEYKGTDLNRLYACTSALKQSSIFVTPKDQTTAASSSLRRLCNFLRSVFQSNCQHAAYNEPAVLCFRGIDGTGKTQAVEQCCHAAMEKWQSSYCPETFVCRIKGGMVASAKHRGNVWFAVRTQIARCMRLDDVDRIRESLRATWGKSYNRRLVLIVDKCTYFFGNDERMKALATLLRWSCNSKMQVAMIVITADKMTEERISEMNVHRNPFRTVTMNPYSEKELEHILGAYVGRSVVHPEVLTRIALHVGQGINNLKNALSLTEDVIKRRIRSCKNEVSSSGFLVTMTDFEAEMARFVQVHRRHSDSGFTSQDQYSRRLTGQYKRRLSDTYSDRTTREASKLSSSYSDMAQKRREEQPQPPDVDKEVLSPAYSTSKKQRRGSLTECAIDGGQITVANPPQQTFLVETANGTWQCLLCMCSGIQRQQVAEHCLKERHQKLLANTGKLKDGSRKEMFPTTTKSSGTVASQATSSISKADGTKDSADKQGVAYSVNVNTTSSKAKKSLSDIPCREEKAYKTHPVSIIMSPDPRPTFACTVDEREETVVTLKQQRPIEEKMANLTAERFGKWDQFWEDVSVIGMGITSKVDQSKPKTELLKTAFRHRLAGSSAANPVLNGQWGTTRDMQHSYQDGDVALLLRMLPVDSSAYADRRADCHLWPKGTFLQVNGKRVKITQRRQMSHIRTSWEGISRACDLTGCIEDPKQNNTIEVGCIDEQEYVYALTISRYLSVDRLFARFTGDNSPHAIPTLAHQEAIDKAVRYAREHVALTIEDDESVESDEDGKFVFTLTCPISKTLLITPVRGKKCTHFQCYDLRAYLSSNSCVSGSRWRCASCDNFVSVDDLEICGFTLHLLREFRHSLSETEQRNRIEMRSDRSYRLLEEAKSRGTGRKGRIVIVPDTIQGVTKTRSPEVIDLV